MLMFKLNAPRVGVLATLLGITFAACNNDDDNPTPNFRSKEYKLVQGAGADSSAQIGVIQLSENADSSVNLTVTLNKTTADIVHQLFLIGGNATTPTTDTIQKQEITGTGNAVTTQLWKDIDSVTVGEERRKFTYDSALAINAFAKVRYSAEKDSVIAIGNILKSE